LNAGILGIEQAADVVLIDTAGGAHKERLMDELGTVKGSSRSYIRGRGGMLSARRHHWPERASPARVFGRVVTWKASDHKLDRTAKGGIVIAVP